MHFHTVVFQGEPIPYVDFVTQRTAYAVGAKDECYFMRVYKRVPYNKDRQDWERVDWGELPKWVRHKFVEVEPMLRLML